MKNALIVGTLCLSCGLACAQSANARNVPDALPKFETNAGAIAVNDGTFNYQGYLEVNGAPANGMYSFRFEAFNEPTGPDISHELYFTSDLVPVVDGLFSVDVQMGGNASEARRFWREIGNQEMYFEIGVGEFEGGPYTTLGTRTKLSWSARAQYAGIAESLRFPYADSFANPDGEVSTMIYLENDFGGSIFELVTYTSSNEPMIDLTGPLPYGIDFASQNGAIRIDDSDERVGILSTTSEFPLVGYLQNPEPGTGGAVLGQVANGAGEGYFAVSGINSNTGNRGYLGGENEAGLFFGDVLVNGNINKSYGSSSEASAAPIAYGFINSSGSVASGSGNFTCTWDSGQLKYDITIENESYFFSNYTTVITPATGSSPRVSSTGSVGGKLLVYTFNPLSGYARTQTAFQFVVYKSDPNTTVINRNTTDMDDSEFYRLNGLTPEVVRTQPRVRPSVAGEGITEQR